MNFWETVPVELGLGSSAGVSVKLRIVFDLATESMATTRIEPRPVSVIPAV